MTFIVLIAFSLWFAAGLSVHRAALKVRRWTERNWSWFETEEPDAEFRESVAEMSELAVQLPVLGFALFTAPMVLGSWLGLRYLRQLEKRHAENPSNAHTGEGIR